MNKQYIFLGLAVVLAIIIGAMMFNPKTQSISTKETYNDMFSASSYARNGIVARPNFKADLAPRFDATQARAGAIIGSPPPFSMQGAPVTPVESIAEANTEAAPNFTTLGGAYDSRLPSAGLTTSQVNDILAQKYGRQGVEEMASSSALLPMADMRTSLTKDPSEASTFMYDRYLFAPLGRRHGKVGVDFIRGDLQIAPIRSGWFDVAAPVKSDLAQGYFADFLDIQQSTSLQDAVFERAPGPLQNANPWGDVEQRTINSIV